MQLLDIDKLTNSERLKLIDALWDSMETEPVPLSTQQKAEAQRRYDDFDADPTQKLFSWEEIKAEIRSR